MRPFIQRPALKRYQLHRDLAILVVTVAAFAVPFLNQPFHMDDNFYMDMARNAQVKPLFPNDTPYVFQGQYLRDMGSHSHPPLQTYFLALIQRFFGEGPGKEWIYHTIALVYPILAAIAFYFICARLVERPLWPSIVLACSPLFLVMQHTLMTDVPTLAFWLAAIASFLWATDRKSTGLYASSTFFQIAAMLTSYQSIALTPLLGFYNLRKRGGGIGWLSVLTAPALMCAWFTLNYFHYHRILLVDTLGYIQSRHPATMHALGNKLLALLGYQGWLMLFPFFLLYVFGRGLKWRILALVVVTAVYLAQLSVPEYRLVDKAIFVAGIAAGAFVVLRMGIFFCNVTRDGKESLGFDAADGAFIGLWYFGVLSYCMFLLPEGSARHILPLVPPFLICFFRQLEISEITEYRLQTRPYLNSAMLASGSLVVSLVWGLALSQADQEFARVYPRAANEFSRITGGMESYYSGEWGFRYYFQQAGVRQLPVDESLVRGASFLASPRLALPYDLPADLRSMTMPLQTLTYELETPIRILDWQTPAGFYSSAWGLIPFSLSRKTLEEVEIRQVNFMVERLPWAKIESSSGVKPWPGYPTIQGRSPLAILARPGTRIIYPWLARAPLDLELKCGLSSDACVKGVSTRFEFDIRLLDVTDKTLASFSKTLQPGIKKADRDWLPVRILLQSTAQGASALEFSYSCGANDSPGLGAFAEAILRQPE